jgi:hypothetical protein
LTDLSPFCLASDPAIDNSTVSSRYCRQTENLWESAKIVISQKLCISPDEIEWKELIEGSFNKIFRFKIQTKNYVMRIREKESDFAFEKIAKEPFAILVLENLDSSDRKLRDAIKNLHKKSFVIFLNILLLARFIIQIGRNKINYFLIYFVSMNGSKEPRFIQILHLKILMLPEDCWLKFIKELFLLVIPQFSILD